MLNTIPPAAYYTVTATCGYLQCTKSYVFTLTSSLKGSYYKYHLLGNAGVLNLRILFSPSGSIKKTLLTEWNEQTGSDGYRVGLPFEGRFGDKIILELDLPSGQFAFADDDGHSASISIGDRENAPIQPTSTPVPTSDTWKNVSLISVNAGKPVANKAMAFGYYYDKTWYFVNGFTDKQGMVKFRLPLQDSGQSCIFAFGNSENELYMSSMHQTLPYYQSPAAYTQTDLVFQMDENNKVTILQGTVETLFP